MKLLFLAIVFVSTGYAQVSDPSKYVPGPLRKTGQTSGEAVNLAPAAVAPATAGPTAVHAPTPPAPQVVQPGTALPAAPVVGSNTPPTVWSPTPVKPAANPWQPAKPPANPWETKPATSPWK